VFQVGQHQHARTLLYSLKYFIVVGHMRPASTLTKRHYNTYFCSSVGKVSCDETT
jgi:hypothetical protein